MIPSTQTMTGTAATVYQRGLVIDSQPIKVFPVVDLSISKGIGD